MYLSLFTLVLVSVVASVNYNEILQISSKESGTCFSNRRCGTGNRFVRAISGHQPAESTESEANRNIHSCCRSNGRSIILGQRNGASQPHQICAVCFVYCYKTSRSCSSSKRPTRVNSIKQCCNRGNAAALIPFWFLDGTYPGRGLGNADGGICMRCPRSGGGGDPHFAVLLPSKDQLCFTVQGEQGFIFNLVTSPELTINALFVQDSIREEVTWMGTISVILNHDSYKGAARTTLRFDANSHLVYINEREKFDARQISAITLANGLLEANTQYYQNSSVYPTVTIDVKKLGLHFSVQYVNSHLNLIYQNIPTTIEKCDYSGLLGQFFCPGYSIDHTTKLLHFPDNKEPVPVMRRPIWSFMETKVNELTGAELCWMAMNVGYEGEGLLRGHYLDYVVSDLFTTLNI